MMHGDGRDVAGERQQVFAEIRRERLRAVVERQPLEERVADPVRHAPDDEGRPRRSPWWTPITRPMMGRLTRVMIRMRADTGLRYSRNSLNPLAIDTEYLWDQIAR